MGDSFSHNERNGTRQFGSRYISALVSKMSDGQFLIRSNDQLERDAHLLSLVNEGAEFNVLTRQVITLKMTIHRLFLVRLCRLA